MELNFKKNGNVVIIYLKGRLDVHHSADIEEELDRLILMEPASHFIVNMQDVEYISSSGLRIIVSTMKTLKANKRKMLLCCINKAVRKVFEIVEIINIFQIFDTEEKALEYLNNL